VALLVVVLVVAGCGGSGNVVVARVGGTAVSRSELSDWMGTLAGSDFYEVSKAHTIPAGLVSDPPDYSKCVSGLEAAAPRAAAVGTKATAAQLLEKCRQLYQALKRQAMGFLIDYNWTEHVLADEGLRVSDSEVTAKLVRVKAEQFPKASEYQQYLSRRRRSQAAEELLLKLDLISQKALEKLQAGGKQAAARITETEQRWTAQTSCQPGYVVKHCKQYTPPASPAKPSPAVVLEQIAVITGRPCINRAGCG
jgi:foldase protein PrsA